VNFDSGKYRLKALSVSNASPESLLSSKAEIGADLDQDLQKCASHPGAAADSGHSEGPRRVSRRLTAPLVGRQRNSDDTIDFESSPWV
jgi:hypothetical protein